MAVAFYSKNGKIKPGVLHQWKLNKANEAKLKINQREDEVQIGDRTVCFSSFLYFCVTLNHISSEFQSYI
jgi:hypothetical protein